MLKSENITRKKAWRGWRACFFLLVAFLFFFRRFFARPLVLRLSLSNYEYGIRELDSLWTRVWRLETLAHPPLAGSLACLRLPARAMARTYSCKRPDAIGGGARRFQGGGGI